MRLKPAYRPAELVQGSSRWYIKVYAPDRKRMTFDLNRIHDLGLRRERGQQLVSLINWWLAADMPLERFNERIARKRQQESLAAKVAPRGHVPLRQALYKAVEIKEAKTREASGKSYRSHANVFFDYLERNDLGAMPVDELELYHLVDFMDDRKLRDGVRNNTINNAIIHLGALFTELKGRGYIIDNHWHSLKKLPPEKKKRRAFKPDEAQRAFTYFYEHDPYLSLAILFQYCCLMRPNEVRNLRTTEVNLETGVVTILPEIGKTSRNINTRYATIPKSYEHYFRELMPTGRGYIFGQGFAFHANKPCNKGRMYKRHLKGVKEMLATGILEDATGIEFYSWKDTGVTHAANAMDIIHVRNQAGHTATSTTLKYYEKPIVNDEFRKMENTLTKKGAA
ncbi:MAG: site-specific integrase [Bacteroidota bacterium]